MTSPVRFSLFEGLILVLIVGTLTSLAVPLRQQAVNATGLAKCRGNLYEVGAAVHLFASENGGRLPGNYDPTTGDPSILHGTYIADGRMYGQLITPAVGGFGEYDYLGRVHPLICPSLSPQLFDLYPEYKRAEEIHSGNKIVRMGYFWSYYPYAGYLHAESRANDTVHGNPHNALMFDFGWARGAGPGGAISAQFPSHPEVMNVLHLGGHVTTFPIEEANQYGTWTSLYDALREHSSSQTHP